MSFDRILERCANVTMVVAGLAVAINIGLGWYRNAQSHRVSAMGTELSAKGAAAKLEGVSASSLGVSATGAGFILFVSPNCRYCELSLPFYRRLIQSAARKHAGIFVAVSGTRDSSADYLRTRGMTEAIAVSAEPLVRAGLRATPTVLMFDRSGTIRGSWAGLLSREQEETVLSETGTL